MKKIICILFVAMLLTGCSKNSVVDKTEEDTGKRFKCVEKVFPYCIMVDSKTGVAYAVSRGGYNCGNFTLLVDADGKPLIWDESEDNE